MASRIQTGLIRLKRFKKNNSTDFKKNYVKIIMSYTNTEWCAGAMNLMQSTLSVKLSLQEAVCVRIDSCYIAYFKLCVPASLIFLIVPAICNKYARYLGNRL